VNIMSNKAEESGISGKQNQGKRPSSISAIVDAVSKLAAAGAIVFGAFIANTYQAKMSSINVINQREQAESQLRADMFSSLISPIVGPSSSDVRSKPERERLLVELLALNFHEHFEFKPLIEYVDERLTIELSEEQANKEIKSLRSVARRVKDRQITMLVNEGADPPYNLFLNYIPKSELNKYDLSPARPEDESYDIKAWTSDEICQPIQIVSLNENWKLNISIVEIDWDKQKVGVRMSVEGKSVNNGKSDVAIPEKFTLTWYDFPLTDNTSLPDGNRFSLVIDTMDRIQNFIHLRLIWFPKDFFTPRERPINYRQFLEKLGIKMKANQKEEQTKTPN
jgi:hypothetical protein